MAGTDADILLAPIAMAARRVAQLNALSFRVAGDGGTGRAGGHGPQLHHLVRREQAAVTVMVRRRVLVRKHIRDQGNVLEPGGGIDIVDELFEGRPLEELGRVAAVRRERRAIHRHLAADVHTCAKVGACAHVQAFIGHQHAHHGIPGSGPVEPVPERVHVKSVLPGTDVRHRAGRR